MKKSWPFSSVLPLSWLLLWGAASLSLLWSDPSHVLERSLRGPDLLHLMGFDAFGRNLLATVLRASAVSCLFAITATIVSCAAGITAGALLAMSPKWARFFLLRTLELLLAFPSLLLALAIAAVSGPGWGTLMVALMIGSVPAFTRLSYARTLELLSEEYILAARGLGAGPLRIFLRHLAPALLSLCSIKAPNLFAHALMAEATLSFIGAGAPAGRDSWGTLLAQGKDYLVEAPHIAFGAGVPLVLTVLALQLLSEKLSRKR
ncbi:MAG: hypothetical protein A2583_00450 [Bdellovibrionales bacterium RIFOXYD1_FULL_53_11]|nr:MAG: hypothetical protein A2583_00450 [Bdellovibrionales bacterium RIFOXYD1_FULL_53_11]